MSDGQQNQMTVQRGSGRMDDSMDERTSTDDRIDRLTSRHIARCLAQLGDDFAPALARSIKRSFRFFAEDVKQVTQVASTENEHGGIHKAGT